MRISQPPPRGAVNLNQAGDDFALRDGQRVLLGDQRLFDLRDRGEIDRAGLVLDQCDLDRFLGLIDAFRLEASALLAAEKRDHAVFGVLIGVQDRLLIGGD